MCSTGKRSFGQDSDDDFDDSLHKRLKIRRRETKLKTKRTRKAKQSQQRLQVRIQEVNCNASTKSTSSYNTSVSVTDTVTNSTIPSAAGNGSSNGSIVNEESRNEDECLGIVNDQSLDFNCSSLSDSRLSADQIISDILGDSFGDECDDAAVTVSVDQSTTATTSSIQSRLPEVPSPKKQSSLFQYFKLKGGKSIHENSSSDGSSTSKSCLPITIHHSSYKTAPTSHYNKSKRDCPFYKKIPGTFNNVHIITL